ncbi:sulfur carrier protein ThiS [Helicovermis profundi]|uniref:Sulfur carrier protein ThiS n=1 Tax=Helicovermis profundi TaxID=3065157 RepID=A0AAU9E843_9FIRM|nr:sulfur carrier protein ThiS [Clostridia bacterium S502]
MYVNGKQIGCDYSNVKELLEKMNLDFEKVVVEVNKEIISKSQYDKKKIFDKDSIEIIGFIGGG